MPRIALIAALRAMALYAMAVCAMALPAAAQQTAPRPVLPDETSNDEIIVSALRIPRAKLPTRVYWDYYTLYVSRIARENAEMFLRCALRSPDREHLRRVVDGEPNSANARYAQGWIIVAHRACYPAIQSSGLSAANRQANIIDFGQSELDRGIIVETVLRSFAPDAELTSAITNDPVIWSRFKAREGFRNRMRLPQDRDAMIFATCLVRQQPVLATRLFQSTPGSLLERGLVQTIIVEGRGCVGRAKRVTINPSLARVYIIDAFYRWIVAAGNVDSLIPAGA